MVENGVFLSSAELFDPATGCFSTTDNMHLVAWATAQRFSLMAPYLSPEDWLDGSSKGVSGRFVVAGSVGTTTEAVYR
jgi:hypothetical protein